MFFGVDFDAGRAERQQTLSVLTEVEDKLLGMEGTMFGFVDLFTHLWNSSSKNYIFFKFKD